jgi:hypothetical protein
MYLIHISFWSSDQYSSLLPKPYLAAQPNPYSNLLPEVVRHEREMQGGKKKILPKEINAKRFF